MDPKKAIYLLLQELKQRTDLGDLANFYPDEGPFRRELYPKHVAMLHAGAEHSERAAMGGNRVGKTVGIGGYETALHLTGLYPPWWEGHRFDRKILAWACGTKSSKVRDVNQRKLIGGLKRIATTTLGMGALIPRRCIGRITRKSGVTDAVDQVVIKHRLGFDNLLTFKSYEEGRTAFEAEAVDWIWLDEEPTKPIYDECKARLLTTRGLILSTLTPVEGMTEAVMGLLEGTTFL